MNPSVIYKMAPKAAPGWAEELSVMMPLYDINTPTRESMFLAQCAHETSGFTKFVENLNYSAEGLMRTWPSRFPSRASTVDYARKPEKIANHVYANRLGNGNEASGDGWLYRGRGCIQLTGKRNYIRAGQSIGYPLERYPNDAAIPELGAKVACWLWALNGLNELADAGKFQMITRRINGGLIGEKDRELWLAKARNMLLLDYAGPRYV